MADSELSPEPPDAAVIDDVLATGDRKVQMMKVTRLHVVRMEQDYHSFSRKQPAEISTYKQLPSLEDLIEFFIARYNEENGTKIDESIEEDDDQSCIEFGSSLDIYAEEIKASPNKNQPKKNKRDGFYRLALDERWVRDKEGCEFKLIIYERHAVLKSKLTAELQRAGSSSADSSDTSRILCYLRKGSDGPGCIYTLTTGHRGYIPLRKYTDYSFSRKITVWLLDGKTIEQEQCKFVLGDVKWMHVARREKPCFDPNDAVKIFTKFEACLKPSASLYGLPQLGMKTKKDGTPAENIHVEVSLGGIKLKKSLQLSAYSYILDHYEKIVCGEPTYEYMTDRQEVDSEEGFENLFYYSYISDSKLYKALNEQVVKELVQNIVAPEGCVKTWDFAAPQAQTYYQATEFELYYAVLRNSQTAKFSHRISFDELIYTLREFSDKLGCEQSALADMLHKTHFKFRAKGKWECCCLVDCLTGQVETRERDGSVVTYFKLNRAWYKIHHNLHKSVDKQFQQCLEECMLFEGDEGFLPDYWTDKEMAEEDLAKALHIKKEDVKNLHSKQFSYVDEFGNVVWRDLCGEILLFPHFAECAERIRSLLENSTNITLQLLEKTLDPDCALYCEYFWKELVKTRTVGQLYKNHRGKEKVRVKNSYYPEGSVKQRATLSKIANLHNWVRSKEQSYNKGYLYTVKNLSMNGDSNPFTLNDDFGYLFGDCIIVDGIELFDILFYTKKTTYLVQVKKGFGQGTRDACSQLSNSKIIVSNMLGNSSKKDSFLRKFYTESTKPGLKDANVRNQMLVFGYENFEKLFSGDRKMVFVLAFLDERSRDYHELTREDVSKDRFYWKDFSVDRPSELGELVFQELVSQRYLDKDGRKDVAYFSMTKESDLIFRNDSLQRDQQLRKQVYKVLRGGLGKFSSLIARLEVLQLRAEMSKARFGFKICQIRRPPGTSLEDCDSSPVDSTVDWMK